MGAPRQNSGGRSRPPSTCRAACRDRRRRSPLTPHRAAALAALSSVVVAVALVVTASLPSVAFFGVAPMIIGLGIALINARVANVNRQTAAENAATAAVNSDMAAMNRETARLNNETAHLNNEAAKLSFARAASDRPPSPAAKASLRSVDSVDDATASPS